jgi:hypothetical protein
MGLINYIKLKWELIIGGLILGACLNIGFVIVSKIIGILPTFMNTRINLSFTIGDALWYIFLFSPIFILFASIVWFIGGKISYGRYSKI